ncbi:MAG: ABC transporter permease [Armatimonadota bacterium]
MKGLMKLTWVEFKLFLREPMLGLFTFLFPLMMLFVFGGVYGNKPSPYFGGYGMVDVSVPAWAGLIIANTGFISLAVSVASYRERGVLRRFRLTPMRPRAILVAQIAVLLLMTVLGMALLVVAAKLVFAVQLRGNLVSVAAGFVLGSLSIFAIGFVVAGIAPTARAAQAVGMVLFFPMIFLSGSTIPLENIKGAIRALAEALPLTHVVTLMRGLWLGDPWSQHLTEVAVLGGVLLLGAAISTWLFRWE